MEEKFQVALLLSMIILFKLEVILPFAELVFRAQRRDTLKVYFQKLPMDKTDMTLLIPREC